MIDQNDVVWTPIQIPVKPTPVTPETPVGGGETPSVVADQAIKPEKAAATPVTPVVGEDPSPTRALLGRAVARMRYTWIPPDIVRHKRPSLLMVIAYGWRGAWGPEKGPIRTLGKIYAATLGVFGVASGYAWAWIWERPARLFAACLLGTAIIWTLKSLGWV